MKDQIDSRNRHAFPLLPGLLLSLLLGACATPDGWRGADAELQYEVESARRGAQQLDHLHYFEVHRDGRIHVFSDPAVLRQWQLGAPMPHSLTEVGAGPAGQTLVFQAGPADTARRLYHGRLLGAETGFHAEVHRRDTVWVFDRGSLLRQFQRQGRVDCADRSRAADGVIYVQDCAAASLSPPLAAMRRHREYAAQAVGLP